MIYIKRQSKTSKKNILIIQFGRMENLFQTIPSLFFLLQKYFKTSLSLLRIYECPSKQAW